MGYKTTNVPQKRKPSVRDFGKAVSPEEINRMNQKHYDSLPGPTVEELSSPSAGTPEEINRANRNYWDAIQKKRDPSVEGI